MQFEDVDALRKHSPAWRLLRADNAPLILSFLHRIFVEDNVRTITSTELVSLLDDELYALNERLGEGTFPKTAKAYLDDWSAPEAGWLRKYYPAGSDEPHFDATPAVEKAISWVRSLQARSFVGTESRLNTIFELLRQMVYGAEGDPEVRLEELRRRRHELDVEIAEAERGNVDVLDAASQRDRYQQFSSMARDLLSDFREVEANFRILDRQLREKVAAWSGSKGELLDEVLGDRDAIADSDQGTSFQAFYDFLLSPDKQDELKGLLDRVQQLDAIDEKDPRMRRIHFDWLDACERTQDTVRLLSDQLRRFLDDQAWLENRRVMDLLRSIEATALDLRDHGAPPMTFEIDGTVPAIVLPMERPLYTPSAKTPIDSSVESGDEEVDSSVLFDQVYIDRARLAVDVRRALQQRSQVGLPELVGEHPLEHGLAELVGYLSLTDDSFGVVFDETSRERVNWRDADGRERVATLPRVTFVRTGPGEGEAT
ncbi:DUF3375 domain-containing protein [Phytoactinopolyspora halotolerans]|uniref:DUF3375 domain-containing protein n=1 Tax=Phytoactinopolyspora halotolerans TaxID=1981512 RepID=A0A6L9S6T4_9ACTN|nr:DUF3375 domain-containing protein [Phytoactinopolyspora halotolerans]NEE00866.1 DUF3375 domain-containing protein [Phytoactinopolyspora halotolerans]